ncbi:hypothetical protein NQ317_016536 [Molorchus minor]|uniref:Uncharacterized protein n=1 Tax=Molorchus minor TaxID=1323400 RepID=A0ABQ9IW65_9CUCU|nr:hypothetical protein NQ317_016536 [Molorchus minor]
MTFIGGLKNNIQYKENIIKHINYDKLREQLSDVDWSDVYNLKDVESATKAFLSIIENKITLCTKVTKIKNSKYKRKCWITNGIIKSIENRDKLFREVQLEPLNEDLKQAPFQATSLQALPRSDTNVLYILSKEFYCIEFDIGNLQGKDINNLYLLDNKDGKVSPIILEFISFLDKQEVYKNIQKLKGTGVAIANDASLDELKELELNSETSSESEEEEKGVESASNNLNSAPLVQSNPTGKNTSGKGTQKRKRSKIYYSPKTRSAKQGSK